jgi:catechol 2,3-dioxygenase
MKALVQRLGYVSLNVVDLETAVRDAETISGARVVDRLPDRVLMSSNRRRAELALHAAAQSGVRCIGLEALSADAVEEIKARAHRAGLAVIADRPSLEFVDRAVTFLSSEGHAFEVHTPVPQDQTIRYTGAGIHPNCLDHVNLTSTNPKQLSDELQSVLGFRLSERTINHELVWLRAGDGRHHTVGIVGAPAAGLHHFSWELRDFNDFKRLGDVLDSEDRLLIWGPGRHGAGDNLFAYYFDRSGFMVECTAEMEVIHDENHQPPIFDVASLAVNPKAGNRWGQLPPPAWVAHSNSFTPYRRAVG